MLCTNVICNGSFPARTFSIYFSFSLYSANIAGPNFALIVVCVWVEEREKNLLREISTKGSNRQVVWAYMPRERNNIESLSINAHRKPVTLYSLQRVCVFFFFTFLLFTRMFTTISFGLVFL